MRDIAAKTEDIPETEVQECMIAPHTYIDQSEVVLIHRKLFWSDLLFQGRGIGALQNRKKQP